MAHFKYRRYIAAVFFLLAVCRSYSLESYQATYQVSVRGVSAGVVRHDAIFTDLTYRVDTVATPSLAAKMLGFDVITESSKGLLDHGRVIPQRYQRSMEGDADFRLVYDYHPKVHEIEAQIGNSQQVLKYDEGIQPLDVLSLVVQTLIDDEQHKIAAKYTMISDDKIRTYTVEKLPNETWQTKSGGNINIRVFRQISGDRQTKIYFADNPLRLVQLTQIKGDQARFSLKLMDYRVI
ncbi:DUF3108 domain-containing protein [Cardiobacteriaceae bacterium TAE3-ERU3]|nr:DUF3108 domain-containing protein [Cardiobacteriaceae bacterium TAE3-ERU3]